MYVHRSQLRNEVFQFIAVATALCTVTRVNADSNNIINKDTNLVRASSRYDVPTLKRYGIRGSRRTHPLPAWRGQPTI